MEASDAINTVSNVAKQIEQQYFSPVFMMAQTAVAVITSTVFVLKTNLVLGFIYIMLSTLSFLPSHIGKNEMGRFASRWSLANAKLVAIMKDIFQGRMEIRNFNVKAIFMNKFAQKLNHEEAKYQKMTAFQYLIQFCAWVFAIVSFFLPIIIGIALSHVPALRITPSVIITLMLTADSVVGGIRELTSFQSMIVSTNKLRTVKLDFGPNHGNDQPKLDVNQGLNISHLAAERNHKVIFKNVNLKVAKNKKVIITGPSGVGKSTLLDMIAGQLTSSFGSVRFEDGSIQPQDFVFISQSVWLFDGTIRDNLTLYQNYSDQQLEKVMTAVGLNQELGHHALDFKIINNGGNVSGGQAQRIAIARGLLRKKPIFILDEITSSLDEKRADEIHQLIYHLPSIVLEVAHNFNVKLAHENGVSIYHLSSKGLKEI